MKSGDPPGLSVATLSGAAGILIYLAGAGCTPTPKFPDPLTPVVQSVEITHAPSHIANGGTPETGQYKITLKHPAQDGQGITVRIFEDDERFDERIVEVHVTLEAGSVEHTGSFQLACDEDGSMIGSGVGAGFNNEDGEYEVYVSVVDGIGELVEEPMAHRVRCVPPQSSQ
jgi:hypothetical protein